MGTEPDSTTLYSHPWPEPDFNTYQGICTALRRKYTIRELKNYTDTSRYYHHVPTSRCGQAVYPNPRFLA